MINAKLSAIAQTASENLVSLISEAEDKLLEAWRACEQEAQDNEQKPKFKIALSITLDLDADKMETALTFGIRHKLTADSAIPNPDQMNLEIHDN